MWLNLFAHVHPGVEPLYSAHACAAKDEKDVGGMQSRPPESWHSLYSALQQAGIEAQVINELKQWLDKDPVRPVQVEITVHQASLLGLDASEMIQ
jgi:phage-related baseplate assembly protein